MKFTCFHLMPYRPLDLKAAAEHRSAWVVLPNSFYDPKKGAAEYDSYLDQLTYAEKLGFDVIGVNEHHQTAYGMMPAPNLIASALIQRTKTAKIAVLGRALPIVGNPINIAEEFAMLDVLSKGRLIAGFVRGIGAEYHSTGVNPAFSHERFHEAHDLIIKAWTTVGPFEFEGNHFRNRYVNLWPRPYQTPHPPVWIPSMGSRETIEWASAPERKYPFLVTFSAPKPPWCAISTCITRRRSHARLRRRGKPARLGGAALCRRYRCARQARKPGPGSKACSIIFCRCRGKCCCRPATRRMRRSKPR